MKRAPLTWALSSAALFVVFSLVLYYFILEEPINTVFFIRTFLVAGCLALVNYLIFNDKRKRSA